MGNSPKRNIFVSIPTEEHAERLKLEGVLAYAHDKRGCKWNVQPDPGGLVTHVAKNHRRYGIGGIIAYVANERTRRALSRIACPCVLIEDQHLPPKPITGKRLVTLVCDHFEEGRKAAAYFLSRHFTNFAWVDQTARTQWAALRKAGFRSALRERGFDCLCYTPPKGIAIRINFALELPTLCDWLHALPRPCALLASRDSRARQVIMAADEAGIPIPEGLAVLGVDNDEIICTTSIPSLSSIATSDRVIGYTAGRILNELMIGKAAGRVVRSTHSHVVTRLSTDTESLADPIVAKALKYVRQHLSENFDADVLARHVNFPRHALQSRAEKTLGITLGREIRRIRLATATTMLVGSTLSVEEIAQRCGFTGTSHLSMRMKEAYGITPLAYRKRSASVCKG